MSVAGIDIKLEQKYINLFKNSEDALNKGQASKTTIIN